MLCERRAWACTLSRGTFIWIPQSRVISLSRYDRPNSQNHKNKYWARWSSRAAGNPHCSGWHVDCHYCESLSRHGHCYASLSLQRRSLWAMWTALHLILLVVISSSRKGYNNRPTTYLYEDIIQGKPTRPDWYRTTSITLDAIAT